MSRRRPTQRWILAVCLTALSFVPARAEVKGRSYGVYVSLPSHGVWSTYHCDTGWLDRASGGSRSSYKSNVSYGALLKVDYMESESHGDRCKGHSGSRLEAGYLMQGQPFEVTWTHMESADEDTCCRPQDRDDLPSRITGLTFGGVPVTVTGQPNQVLSLPGVATLIVNEVKHEADADCDDDDEEHHALHLVLKNGDEVILCSTKFDSDDDCCLLTPTRTGTWGAVKAHYR